MGARKRADGTRRQMMWQQQDVLSERVDLFLLDSTHGPDFAAERAEINFFAHCVILAASAVKLISSRNLAHGIM